MSGGAIDRGHKGGIGLPFGKSTGLISGGQLSVASASSFNVAEGLGMHCDSHTDSNLPSEQFTQWGNLGDISATCLSTGSVTYVGVNCDGELIQQNTPFDSAQRRGVIQLGMLSHAEGSLTSVKNAQQSLVAPLNQLYDLMDSIGAINVSGNLLLPAGGLHLSKTEGVLFKAGAGWALSATDPNRALLPQLDRVPLTCRTQDGTNVPVGGEINTNLYDVGGIPTAIPALQYTVQRVYCYTDGSVKVQLGQSHHASREEALAAVRTEEFITEEGIANNGLLRALVVVQQGATELDYKDIIKADRFGGV